MEVSPGTRLGPYEILAPLGAGGMGAVYRARDTRLGREVAVKVLPPHLMDSPDALARFEREMQAVAALNHPNILALHDVGRDGSIAYAVTELLQGDTLRGAISKGPMPVRRALNVLAQIARGLGAAHDRGIVHRDIKPENLFLTRDGHLKILDFGVATQTTTTPASDSPTMYGTQPGVVVGTLAYMAPEQLAGQPATPRSDVFAFGIVAHELLTGVHPFARPTVTETMGALLRDEAPPLGRTVRELHPAAARVLAHCLEKTPGERLGSTRDLAIYLDALSNAPDFATGDSGSTTPETLERVGRRVFYSSLAIVVSLVALIWGYAAFVARGGATTSDLAGAERLIQRVQGERLAQLGLTARLIASFPEVKALFGTDSATVRDFLSSQQAIVPGAPALMAILPDRRILARTDTPADVPAAPGDTWIDTLLTSQDGTGVVTIDGRLYHAARATSDAGGNTFGYIVAAVPVDEGFARALSDAAHDEVVLLSEGMSASTLPGSQTPWHSLEDWRNAGGRTDRTIAIDIGGRTFDAREILLSESPALSAVVAESRDAAATPVRRLQSGFAIIGLMAVLAAIAAASWIRRAMTLR